MPYREDHLKRTGLSVFEQRNYCLIFLGYYETGSPVSDRSVGSPKVAECAGTGLHCTNELLVECVSPSRLI
jgi:hypothetical protein